MPTADQSPRTASGAASAGVAAKASQVELILSELQTLPTLSSIATRVMALTSSDDTSFPQIAALIEADPTLSAKILALCKRATVAMPAGVTSVRRAVVMMGVEALQSAILAIEVYEVLRQMPGSVERREPSALDDPSLPPPRFDAVGFWRHSLGVACTAELLAEAQRGLGVRPEEAFTAGLMHDLGKLVLDWVLPRSYSKVVETAEARAVALAQAERAILGLDHYVVGKRLGEHWGLPHALQDVMWLHGQAYGALPDVKHKTLVALVTLADAVARQQHVGWSGEYNEPPTLRNLVEPLGLSESVVNGVLPRVHEHVASRSSDLGLGETTPPELVAQAMAAANRRLARLHQACRARAAASRQQAKVLGVIERFASAARPGASVGDVLARIAEGWCGLAGEGFTATLYQARAGDAWRLTRYRTDHTAMPSVLLDPPTDGSGRPVDLRSLGVGDALGSTLSLGSWLGQHLGGGSPALGTLRMIALTSGAGPSALLLHDRAGDVLGSEEGAGQALRSAWSFAVVAAAQHEGARRLSEQLAETARELAAAQARLAETESLARLGELTAGAAHELNNPLTVISGRSQLLAQRLHTARDRADAQQIADAAQRLSDLITKLHQVARPPAPSYRLLDMTDVLNAAVKKAVDRYTGSHPGQPVPKIKVIAQIPPGAEGDREMLVRAVGELVANALEAAGVTTITVQAQPGAWADGGGAIPAVGGGGAGVSIQVRDDGSGMSEHALRHAFDPFFSEKPAGRQTGLGLPYARRLLEAHGGTVRLESVQGRGTTASIAMPIKAGGAGFGASVSSGATSGRGDARAGGTGTSALSGPRSGLAA